jgi:hypothetical protein
MTELPERWTERVECSGCGATCHKWDEEGRTCRGKVHVTDIGSGSDEGPVWFHYCDNPNHHVDRFDD